MNIGFIGTGNMGNPMARNLMAAGHRLSVFDLRPEATQNLEEMGAVRANSPAQAAVAGQLVFTSLPGPAEMRQVALGEGGIISALAPGGVYIDLTTNSPTVSREVSRQFAERGLDMLDAPVSGGIHGARTRNLCLMVGGDKAIFERCKPVLDAIGNRVIYTGPSGSGCISKLVNNLIALSSVWLIGEALTLGVKAGADLKALYSVVSQSSGKTWIMENGLKYTLFRGRFEPPAFRLDLAAKDVGLATALAREMSLPLEMASLVEQKYLAGRSRGWGSLTSDAVVRLQEELAGVELRALDLP